MPDPNTILLSDVSKVYRLYESPMEQALDILGLSAIRFWRSLKFTEYPALNGVSLEVKRGERLGVLGRNGAGKTTLLKLITGNFSPSSGTIKVNGMIQALMSVGLGFHPEFTGHQNIRSSLAYNGLSMDQLENAIQDVTEFVELGEFLHQPMKTYSAGMQARVMFAAATAIRPDILIIDEVLGAGDAYFSAKSAHRMEKLAGSGCTLLLVSHSMQQILQFCDRAIWIESGKIVMEDKVLPVVKAYEEYVQKLDWEATKASGHRKSVLENKELRESLLDKTIKGASGEVLSNNSPHVSTGGISRWDNGEPGLKIASVRVLDDQEHEVEIVKTGQSINIRIDVIAQQTGRHPCYFVILLFTEDGRWVTRHCSDIYYIELNEGEQYSVCLRYPETLLGNGTYSFSAAIYKSLDLNHLHSAKFYDLLSRSFEFKVVDTYRDNLSIFHHPSSWVPVD